LISKILNKIIEIDLGLKFYFWRKNSFHKYGNSRWIDLDYGKLYVNCDDLRAFMIDRERGTQKKEVSIFLKMADLKPELFIDVGANYGEFSCAVMNKNIQCIAIEANPYLKSCLDTSFSNSTVKVFNYAISNNYGSCDFYINEQYSGGSSIDKNCPNGKLFLGHKNKIKKVKVNTISLDDLINKELKINFKPLILKIDVESFELEVFKSAQKILESVDWWRAIIEFNPSALKKRGLEVDEIWKYYQQFNGYVIKNNKISMNEIKNLAKKLPKEPPSRIQDILIGSSTIQ
jgi:FkbM family methyltransferase